MLERIHENRPKPLDIDGFRNLLAVRLFKASGNEALRINHILGVLSQAQRNDIHLSGTVGRSGAIRFYLPNQQELKIRVATIDGEQREHRLGLHRFKVVPTIADYNFAIFSMIEGVSITTYIFNTSDISHIKSLGLRFKWFERKSRYDYARDRWSILNT